MVKKTKNYINDTRRIKIPIRSILFWRRKIKSYINTHLLNIIVNKKYPTIYISKKYPKMSILELYERINNHLNKYFPNIYQKLNSNTKNCLKNIKRDPIVKTNDSQTKKTVAVLLILFTLFSWYKNSNGVLTSGRYYSNINIINYPYVSIFNEKDIYEYRDVREVFR